MFLCLMEFGDMKTYFKFLDFNKNLKTRLRPVGKICTVCSLLHSVKTCLYRNATSTYFDCESPTVEGYIV